MVMDYLDYDDEFLRQILSEVKCIALIGASAKQSRASYRVMEYLLDKDYEVLPVNPLLQGQKILGQLVYGALDEISRPIDMVDIFRQSEFVNSIVTEILSLPKLGAAASLPSVVWMQLGVVDIEAAIVAEGEGLRVVMDRCPKIEYERLM